MELNKSTQFVRNKMGAVKIFIFQMFNDNIELIVITVNSCNGKNIFMENFIFRLMKIFLPLHK